MRRQFLAPLGRVFSSGWKNRLLIARLSRREIESRYRASALGLLWSVLVPLLLLAVYTFVFSMVFESRWGTSLGSRYEFALLLFTGLTCFNVLSECLNRAPALMFENVNYIKKVVFPLEVLPWSVVLVALFNAFVSFLVLMIAYVCILGLPPMTAFLVPILLVPLVLMSLAIVWFLSSLGVYIRDVRQAVGILTMMMMFLSPIFYPAEALPADARWLLNLNPLSFTLESVRGALFFDVLPDGEHFTLAFLGSLLAAWLAFSWFEATKKGFADVI